jgi:SET domain-containing protein
MNDQNIINAEELDYLYTKKSQIMNSGSGLYTAITIYKDEIIATYGGTIITNEEAIHLASIKKDAYFINLLDGTILDSMNSDCFARYANDANGFSKTDYKNNCKIALDENNNVCLIALRKIKSGEEIFCSYGKRYWENQTKPIL